MDEVEVNYPVDVAAVADRVTATVAKTEFGASIAACSALLSVKDSTSAVNALESTSLDKVPHMELRRQASQLPGFPSDVSKRLYCNGASSPFWIPRLPDVQVQTKAGRVSKSTGGCSKRRRIAQWDDSAGPAGVDEVRDIDKLGSNPTKCESKEKNQLAKQKNPASSKRVDRRSCKVSMKNKGDSFSVKAGLASFNSAAGGNNFFGLYGLKTEVLDITNLVDDLSLDDLLNGTCECPKLGKDKGKKATNMTENLLDSVRKACSILQLPRPAQYVNFAETCSSSNDKMPMCSSSSVPVVMNGDDGEFSRADLSSSNKDSCSKPETLANLLEFPFDQPKSTLERLALLPPKDLDSLLLDAAKPAVSSRNAPDPRSVKQISRRASLPPFPWSNISSAHCRTSSEAAKLLTSRGTCQARWGRMGNTVGSPGIPSDSFINLDSLIYDTTLVPSCGPSLANVEDINASSVSVPCCERGSSSAAASLTSHVNLESEGNLEFEGKVEHCPRLLAAAETLYDMATHTTRLNQGGKMRWPKKPLPKAMKARKTKSSEKLQVIFAASASLTVSDHILRNGIKETTASKRVKLSTTEDKKIPNHINGVRKGPLSWSTPKSSRSSPSKSVKDSIAESRQSFIMKQSSMMPPPPKVLNKLAAVNSRSVN